MRPRLRAALPAHNQAQRPARASDHTRSLNHATRWQFFRLVEYDVVLHVDSDADPMPLEVPPQAAAARWAQGLATLLQPRKAMRVDGRPVGKGRWGGSDGRGFRGGGMRLIGMADHASPLNGGLLLLRPASWLFRDGLQVLRRCHVNRSHGWDGVGRPHSLGLTQRWFSAAEGGSTTRFDLRSIVNNVFWTFYLNGTVHDA